MTDITRKSNGISWKLHSVGPIMIARANSALKIFETRRNTDTWPSRYVRGEAGEARLLSRRQEEHGCFSFSNAYNIIIAHSKFTIK